MKNALWKIKITSEESFGKVILLPKGEYIFGSDEKEAFFILPSLKPKQFKICIHDFESFDVYDFITQSPVTPQPVGNDEDFLYEVINNDVSFLITRIDNEFYHQGGNESLSGVKDADVDHDDDAEYAPSSNSFFSSGTLFLLAFILILGGAIVFFLQINDTDDDAQQDQDEMVLDSEEDEALMAQNSEIAEGEESLSLDDTSNTELTAQNNLDYIQTIIDASGLNDVIAIQNDDGTITVKGYVQKTHDFTNLAKVIASKNIPVTYEVHVNEQIIASVQDIISQYGYDNVTVLPGEKNGEVILDGFIKNPYTWLDVEKRLKQDVDGLVSWIKKKPIMWEDLNVLFTELKKAGLYERLTINKNGRSVVLTGLLTNQEKEIVDNILDKTGLKEDLEISTSSVPTDYPSLSKVLNSQVSNFVTGKKEYFTLGKNKYFVGSVLPDGSRVVQIKKECVLIYKDNDLLCADPKKG